jgi:hypothetical protein
MPASSSPFNPEALGNCAYPNTSPIEETISGVTQIFKYLLGFQIV